MNACSATPDETITAWQSLVHGSWLIQITPAEKMSSPLDASLHSQIHWFSSVLVNAWPSVDMGMA